MLGAQGKLLRTTDKYSYLRVWTKRCPAISNASVVEHEDRILWIAAEVFDLVRPRERGVVQAGGSSRQRRREK